MPDREKLIKEFELFIKEFHPACTSEGVELDMFREVLALLTEQEAVEPVLDKQTGRMWLCGNCGSYVGFEDNDPHDPNEYDKYCRECGRPVLWEGR